MKRIIMLCSMFVLFFALSVPTFAYYFHGDPVIYTDVNTGEIVSLDNLIRGRVYKVTSADSTYLGMNKYTNVVDFDNVSNSVSNPFVLDGTENIEWEAGFSQSWRYRSAIYIMLELIPCDGSSCPATDGNMDNICDDCGAPFAVPREYTLPDPYAVWTDQTTYPYAMVTLDNKLYLLSELPFYYDIGSYIRHEGASYERYKIENSEWVFDYTSTNPVNLGALEVVQHTSFDLNYEGAILIYRDNDFFPKSLQEVIREGVSDLARETGGTMTILVACGVGLMACLMVLSLFGKRSLISLR